MSSSYVDSRIMVLMIVVALSGLPLATPLQSQTGSVRGTVLDRETLLPLEGANIVLKGTALGAASAPDGSFVISPVPPGRYDLVVSFLGYRTWQVALAVPADSLAPIIARMIPAAVSAQTVVVTALRAREGQTPVAFTDVNAAEIREKNWGQEIPLVLNDVPGLYAYSQTGSGLGYSEVKIRGFDPSRIAVTINNVPLNDPEDHTTYFYDIPDLSSNVEDIQVQRGVGNSLYGGAAIGGSISILTQAVSERPSISLTAGWGSYNTRRLNFAFNSGLLADTYSFYGRFSRLSSDGYRDDAWVKAWSYFFSATRYDESMTTTVNVFGGPVRAHFAWYGLDRATLQMDRRLNFESPQFSDGHQNNVDDFLQTHYQLLNEWKISDRIRFSNTLFHVKGDGYFESFKWDRKFSEYNLPIIMRPDTTIDRTDLVRQKNVGKSQWGWLPRLSIEHDGGTLVLGGEMSLYRSDHWGEVAWARSLPAGVSPGREYYRYDTEKNSFTLYAHELYALTQRIGLMADVQYQHHTYTFDQRRIGAYASKGYSYTLSYDFLTPRVGLHYRLTDEWMLFANGSVAQREPRDADIYDADDPDATPAFQRTASGLDFSQPLVKPETLYDLEAGFGFRSQSWQVKVNGYWMDFHNEIVPTGRVDDDGFIVYGNAERAIHRGVELTGRYSTTFGLEVSANASASDNTFAKYVEPTYDANYNIILQDRKDKIIAGFPCYLANLRLTYRSGGVTAALHAQAIGRQYLDNSETRELSIDPYEVLNLSLSYDMTGVLGGNSLTVDLKVNNVLNRLYETHGAVDAGVAYVVPAAERNVFASLRINI